MPKGKGKGKKGKQKQGKKAERKKSKSGKSGKKPKSSKAERERLKREEEENRLREEAEEQQRLQEEAAEKKRRDKIEAKERQKREHELAKLRNFEHDELRIVLTELNSQITKSLEKGKHERAWQRYLLCDGTPDPINLGEINTYINLLREDTENCKIEYALEQSKLTLNLINELNDKLKELSQGQSDIVKRRQYKETVIALQDLLRDKLNTASQTVLENAIYSADKDTGNLQFSAHNDSISVCVWGNLAKNASEKCLSYPAMKKRVDLPDLPERVETPLAAPEEEKEEDESQAAVDPLLDDLDITAFQTAAKTDPVEPEKETPADDAEKVEEEERPKSVEIIVDESAKTEEEDVEPIDPYQNDSTVINLKQYVMIGGVFEVDLVAVPPQPKQAKEWIMKQVFLPKLRTLKFEVAEEQPRITETTAKELPPLSEELKQASINDGQYVKLNLKWSKKVAVPENEVEIGRWNYEKNCWSKNDIFDVAIDRDAYVNMPLQQWEITATGLNQSVIRLVANFTEVEIEIHDDQCRVNYEEGDKMLEHLQPISGRWMTPLKLIDALKQIGINLFPEKHASTYVSICEKDEDIESLVYLQMAMTASAISYSFSQFNGNENVDKSTVIIQCHDNVSTKAEDINEWSLISLSNSQMYRMKIYEDSEEFSPDMHEHSEIHFDMKHLLNDFVSKEAKDLFDKTSPLFIDTVFQLLNSMKLITFS